jgi:DNA modification methylase
MVIWMKLIKVWFFQIILKIINHLMKIMMNILAKIIWIKISVMIFTKYQLCIWIGYWKRVIKALYKFLNQIKKLKFKKKMEIRYLNIESKLINWKIIILFHFLVKQKNNFSRTSLLFRKTIRKSSSQLDCLSHRIMKYTISTDFYKICYII